MATHRLENQVQPAANCGRLIAVCLLLLAGCHGSDDAASTRPAGPDNAAMTGQYHEELLTYAIDNLNRLEEFESSDALEQMLVRLNQESQQKATPSEQPDPLLATWPEPEMLRQIVDRLNQWIRTQPPSADWKLDPMGASLPSPLAKLPQVEDLDGMRFSRFDGYVLQETVWLRDIGQWARGDLLDDLDRTKCLFDWTVRNIQLEADDAGRAPLFPWETLLFGRGTAAERAWVFVLLARQLGIDAAVLAVGEPWRPWCVAVLIEGNAYLFDPTLGLPIPGPEGVAFDEKGQLTIRPATLAEVMADERLLANLDANEKHPYRVTASDLKRVAVMLEASPSYLSQRMTMLESRLVGPQKMVLTTSPTAQAGHWKAVAPMAEVQLWLHPYETLDRRSHLDQRGVQQRLAAMLPFYGMPTAPLRRGRVLHLKGRFVGDNGATQYYQKARPSNEELNLSSAHPMEKLVYLRGKQDASYWLGLIAYQRQNYPSAVNYFTKRTLLFTSDNPWSDGARYNLARTFEAADDIERAELQYESADSSPGYAGDLLRAKWLRSRGTGVNAERAESIADPAEAGQEMKKPAQ